MFGREKIGWRRVLVLACVTTLTVVAVAEGCRRILDPNRLPARTWIDKATFAREGFAEQCGSESSILITMLHSPEKEAWLLEGAQRFMQRCPNTQVTLDVRPDATALDAIEYGDLRPTMWSPSDELFLDGTAIELEIDAGPGLLRTPFVIAMWQARHDALSTLWSQSSRQWPALEDDPKLLARVSCGGTDRDGVEDLSNPMTWTNWWPWALAQEHLHYGITQPGAPTPEQLQRWGQLDYAHNMPTRTAAGSLTLLMMISAYLHDVGFDEARSDVDFDQLLDAHEVELFDWLRRCEGPREDFEPPPRVLVQRFMQLGPSGFDGVVAYEHLVLEAFDMFDPGQEATPDIELLYPARPFISNHPVVYFPATCDDVRDQPQGSWLADQRYAWALLSGQISERDCAAMSTPSLEAARRFTAFLRGPEMQAVAVEMGYRPGDPDVDITAMRVARNPFLEHRHHGVEFALGPEHVRPRFDFLSDCVQLWSDATERY